MLRLFAYIILSRLLKTNEPIVKINMVQITTLVTLEKVLVDFFLFIPSPSSKKFQIHHTSFLRTPQTTKKTFKEY